MTRFNRDASRWFIYLSGIAWIFTGAAIAQTNVRTTVQHVNFDSPEAWALKYFTSTTMLSGLQPPERPIEERRFGSIAVGLELGWLPALSPEQARVGFGGKKEEDLNKAPIFARPRVTVGLPWRFSLIAAAPPTLRVFGVAPHLFALGLERPILERDQSRLDWRASGQLGSVNGAFTCPNSALGFPSGSPNNPTGCIARSSDTISLRYAGTELQFAHRIPRIPRLTPHVAAGVNFIDGVVQVNAPLERFLDRTRLWTHGTTFSGSVGASYSLTRRVAFVVDAFYSPLGVQRSPTVPRANDGLFNVRALLGYNLR